MHLVQGSQLSWNSWNFTVVLKLSWNQQLSWNFTHLVRMSWYSPMLCCRYTFFTSHDYIYVADVECQVMFSLVTLYCFMCNIASVTFLGLQYWSVQWLTFMSTEKRAFSVSWASWNRQKCPEIVPKISKNLVLKFHFLLLGALLVSFWDKNDTFRVSA